MVFGGVCLFPRISVILPCVHMSEGMAYCSSSRMQSISLPQTKYGGVCLVYSTCPYDRCEQVILIYVISDAVSHLGGKYGQRANSAQQHDTHTPGSPGSPDQATRLHSGYGG